MRPISESDPAADGWLQQSVRRLRRLRRRRPEDNASSTNPQALVGYIEDTPNPPNPSLR